MANKFLKVVPIEIKYKFSNIILIKNKKFCSFSFIIKEPNSVIANLYLKDV